MDCSPSSSSPSPAAPAFRVSDAAADAARWQKRAGNVTIVRDDWGIAHVYGKTDADAVFGMIYAQAEDDFNRVETNYINSLGRLAEAEGEAAVYQDLRMKLFIDPETLKARYAASPAWLKALMDAWADGLNYYLSRIRGEAARDHALRAVDGAVLHRGQHRRRHRALNLTQLQAFYGKAGERTARRARARAGRDEPGGSNGMAVAPANTTGTTRCC